MTHAAHAKLLRLRLFLEGVEVPVIGASVQCAPNSPAVASIQVPPLAEGTRLLPRTTVHLFFLDLYRTGDGTTEDATDASQWRLLFGGEVVGFAWTKSAADRSLVLQCEDWSNYWDYAFQADNSSIFGPSMKAVFSGASTSLFTDFLSSKGEVITNIVTSGRCNTFPQLKGLAAGIIRLLEAVGGTYQLNHSVDGKSPSKLLAGQNVFFSYNELRLKLTQLVGTYYPDTTSERIMQYQGYSGMFNRALGGQGGQVSIRQAVTALSQIIFYEMYPQACPRYKQGGANSVHGYKRTRLADHPELRKVVAAVTEAADSIGAINKDLELLPTAANLAAASREQMQRLQVIQKTLSNIKVRMNAIPPGPMGRITSAGNRLVGAQAALRRLTGGVPDNETTAATIRVISSNYVGAVDDLMSVGDFDVGSDVKSRHPAQLYQQVFRPDVWFTAPPRCNVLFPEAYESLSYQRMFLQEPTRFMLKTNDEAYGEDELFDRFYFAPKAGTIKGKGLNFSGVIGRDLLYHERFTGILPVFEKMGEFNVFASRSDRSKTAIKKVGLAQRTANFLYFRHRFNARKASVVGKFNPYIAVGCPGLIMDKYMDRGTLDHHNDLRAEAGVQKMAASSMLGTSFLGNFTQVSHQVSNKPAVGRTEIVVTFARQPEESIEFLGAMESEGVGDAGLKVASTTQTVVSALQVPAPYTVGPNKGLITSSVVLADTTDRLPVLGVNGRRSSLYRDVVAPTGVDVTARELGGCKEIVDMMGGLDIQRRFMALQITEEVPAYKLSNVVLPAEEYIRPGWYGETWTNANVGKVWKELFATGAITDPAVIMDNGNTSTTLRSERAQLDATQAQYSVSEGDPAAASAAIADLAEGATIQQAVDFLRATYSYVKHAGMDTDEFIGAYTWRPIASMLDMFGSADLEYDTAGLNVIQGEEGFHSKAVGPYSDLFGLVTPEVSSVLGIKRGDSAAVLMDVRGARQEQVQRYLTELLFGNALLG